MAIKGTFSINSGTSGAVNGSRWDGFYGNGIYGNYSVASGGMLNFTNAIMYGAVTVGNGGLFNAGGELNGAVTVGNGGLCNAAGQISGAVTVGSGGVLNSFSVLNLIAPLNNSGTIHLTNNSRIELYNDGTTNNTGSLVNYAGGVIEFLGHGIIAGYGGFDYIVNQGRIIEDSADSGYTVFETDNATNSGTITVQKGATIFGQPVDTAARRQPQCSPE